MLNKDLLLEKSKRRNKLDIALNLINQTIIMFLFAGIGYILFRTKKISLEGSKSIGNILIFVVLPAVIIKGFMVERSKENMIAIGISMLAAIVILFVSVLISRGWFSKNPISCFASAFSNPGFFGVPLIIASLSDGAVFYIASFIGVLNLLQWTVGVSMMTGEKGKASFSALVKAPFFIAIILGLLLFFTQFQLPAIVTSVLSGLTNLNTPLAMFLVGVYLAQVDLLKMLKKKETYLVCFSRLLIIPIASIVVLMLIPETYLNLKLAILIAIACPVGSNVAVYAQLHQRDYKYAVETVVMSTFFSIITLPLVQMFGMWVFSKISLW